MTVRCAAWALGALAIVAQAGCSLFGTTGPRALTSGQGSGGSEQQFTLVEWPSAADVHLSVWIDAGSRDADPPQLATAAAWLAASASPKVHARVTPDTTELHTRCPRQEPARCVRRLVRAVGSREPEQTDVRRLRRRLRSQRRAARAEPDREADTLALQALFGKQARSLQPLGRARDDSRVTAGAIRQFLRDHYGRSRTKWVGAGSIRHQALRAPLRSAWLELPTASSRRAERPPLRPQGGVRVRIGNRSVVSIAATAPDLQTAWAATRELHGAEATARPQHGPRGLRTHAFAIRGAALVLARTPSTGEHVEELAYRLARALREHSGDRSEPTPDGLRAAVRRIGRRWAHRSTTPRDPPELALGLGAVWKGKRADAPAGGGDPDGPVRREAKRQLARARERALRALDPPHRGTVRANAAEIVLDNGAAVAVRRQSDMPRMAITLRYRGGARRDPAQRHGEAALLAMVMSRSCRGLAEPVLERELAEQDAHLRPVVTADGVGLVLDAPAAHWKRAVELAWRCATSPSFTRARVERARLALLARLPEGPDPDLWAARALAPDAPGTIAPWGAPETVARVRRGDLRRRFARLSVGARMRVGVVGDVPTRTVVQRLARRAARLQPGHAPTATPDLKRIPRRVTATEGSGPRAVVAWRTSMDAPSSVAAEVFARTMAERLGTHPGLSAVDHGSGTAAGVAWAAVELEVQIGALEKLDALVQQSQRSVGSALTSRLGGGSDAVAGPAAAAIQLAAPPLHGEPAREATAQALLNARAHFVVARPASPASSGSAGR
jgi:predicted Zn-dependent peptidase